MLSLALLVYALGSGSNRKGSVLTHSQVIGGIEIVGNHPPVWTPNNEESCRKDGPPGGWGSGGPSDGEKNSQLFPDECLNPNPPDYCRGWGSGGCQPNECHVTVTEDSGDLAPHGQRWACEVSDCNADDLGYATQALSWGFGLVGVEHPHYDHRCHPGENNPCPTEHEPHDYTDPCIRSACNCPTWSSSDFWDQGPTAFFRQNDRCNPPLDGPPVCAYGGNPGNGGTGTIQFTTAPDRWGTLYYAVALSDDGISFPVCNGMCGTPMPCAGGCNNAVDINGIPAACNVNPPERTCKVCKLTILPVNDCPVWDSVGDVTVAEDSTGTACMSSRQPSPPKGDAGDRRQYGVCHNNWATGIGAGGWFEWPYQNTWFDCVADNTLLFEAGYLPRVDGVAKLTNDTCVRTCRQDYCQSRRLMYTLAPDQCGSSTVTCTLHDDGGENDDGCDKSPPVTFEIVVQCVNDQPSFSTTRTNIRVDEDPCRTTGDNLATCHNGQWCEDNWATDIRVGPGNELDTYDFIVSVPPADEVYFTSLPTVDDNGRLCFGLAPHYNTQGRGPIPLTVVLRDSGGTANGGVDTSTAVAVALTIAPVNDVPTFSIPPAVVVKEDSGPHTATSFATDICLGDAAGPLCADFNERAPAAGMQTPTFTLTSTKPGLFLVQPAISPTGTLTFTPAADESGTASVDVTLCDNGTPEECSPPKTFVLTVLAVNDPPVVTIPSNVVVVEECNQPSPCSNGRYHSEPWATLSPGPANEDQSVAVVSVIPDDASLFRPDGQPQITANGGLTFTPAVDAHGTTTVRVVVKDNGGTLNGGGDTTEVTFVITILPENDLPVAIAGPDVVVDEDSGPFTKPAWAVMNPGGGEATSGQTLLAPVCVASSASLFASVPQLSVAGALQFTSAPDANGVSDVTCTVTDSLGASVDLTFKVTVNSVNDPPYYDFTVAMPLGLPECKDPSGTCRVSLPIATNISPGPADEVMQGLRFVVNVPLNARQLFPTRQQPYVDASGTLQVVMLRGAKVDGILPFTLSLIDDAGGDDTFTRDMPVVVATQNNAPSFVVGGDVSVLEDSNKQVFRQWASVFSAGEGEDYTQLTATCTADALIASISLDTTTGDLSVTPLPDLFGTTTAHCTVDDSSPVNCCFQQSFPVTVLPVNDKPTFTPNGSVTVWQDSGAFSEQWVTGVDPGPNEGTQSYVFGTEVVSGAELFVYPPAVDETGILTFEVASGVYGTANVRTRVKDDGGVLHGGVNLGDWVPFTIVVKRRNNAPSFVVGGQDTITVLEDAGRVEIPRWVSGATDGEPDVTQQLSYVITLRSGNPSILEGTPVVQDFSTGDLVFTVAPEKSGRLQYDVYLMDSGDGSLPNVNRSPAVVLTIDVLSVNDAPVFSTQGDVYTYEDEGIVVFPLWARGISPGPQEEAGQALMWEPATVTNSELFDALPSVTLKDGNLSFALAPNKHGVSQVSLCLTDDGGVAHNGIDRTCTVFRITVVAVNDALALLKGSNMTVLQTAGEVLVQGWVSVSLRPTDESTKTITSVQLTVEPPVPGLFTEQPTVNVGNGDLMFAVSRARHGVANVKVNAEDSAGGSYEEWFTITVLPAFIQPSFSPGDKITRVQDSPPYSMGWATNIDSGLPPGDTSTELSFSVVWTAGSNALFSAQPSITKEGVLQFKQAPGAHGEAWFDVSLRRPSDTSFLGTSNVSKLMISFQPVFSPPAFTFNSGVIRQQDTAGVVRLPGQVMVTMLSGEGRGYTCEGGTGLLRSFAIESDGTVVIETIAEKVGNATVGCVLNSTEGVSSVQEVVVEVYKVQTATIEGEGDVVVVEDTGDVTLQGWLRLPTTEVPSLTVTNMQLYEVQPTITKEGHLHFRPVSDAFGTSQLTVTLPGVKPYTFTVEVLSVNDPPSFKASSEVRVVSDIEVQWASDITSGGGGREADQEMQFVVEGLAGQVSVLKVPPVINKDGVLKVVVGDSPRSVTETYTVVLVDNGGRANGGADTSLPFKLQLAIDPPVGLPSFVGVAEVTVPSRTFAVLVASNISALQPSEFSVAPMTPFQSPPILSVTDGILRATLLNTWSAGTVVNLTIRIKDPRGEGSSAVTKLVVGYTVTVYEVLLPDGVSVAQLEEALKEDLGAEWGGMEVVKNEAVAGSTWRRVHITLNGGDQTMLEAFQDPMSRVRGLGVADVHVVSSPLPAPTRVPDGPLPVTFVPITLPPSPSDSSLPPWLIITLVLAGLLLLAALLLAAYKAFTPPPDQRPAELHSPEPEPELNESGTPPSNPLHSVFTPPAAH